MRLTNLQLTLLSNRLIEKLREKAAKSSKRAEIEERIKRDVDYEKVVQIVSKYEKLSKQRDKINAEISKMARNFINGKLSGMPYNIKSLDNIIDGKVQNELFKTIPSALEIESDIVLMTMEGGSDIFSKLLAKYETRD